MWKKLLCLFFRGDFLRFLVSKKTLKSDPASLDLGRGTFSWSIYFFILYVGFDPYQKPPDLEMAINHGVIDFSIIFLKHS